MLEHWQEQAYISLYVTRAAQILTISLGQVYNGWYKLPKKNLLVNGNSIEIINYSDFKEIEILLSTFLNSPVSLTLRTAGSISDQFSFIKYMPSY